MGNSDLQQFLEKGLQLRNPPSPKLVVSGNMSQQKTTTGSPKSPKSPDDNSKSDSASSSPSKSGRSPSSTKSSPGSIKSPCLAERLAQSNKAKVNQSLRSPVSKSSPTSPTALVSPKTEVTKESNDNKSDGPEKSKVYNGSFDNKIENTKLSNEKHSVIVENGTNESNEEVKSDVTVELHEVEIKTTDLNEVKENEMEKCNSNETEKCILLNDSHTLDEGLEKKPVRIDDSIILEQTSKKDIRQKVWEFMEENLLVIFPKPCFNRIPNFKGCNNVSLMLEKLDEFKKAKTIQVTPDKAQETARFLTLNWGKRLLVPLLRLKEGLLQNVSLPFAEPSAKMLRSASTQKGLRKWGNKLITLDQNNDVHIDMIILGSVAVDKKGRRIGIGNGFCDLEFVILSSMNMVTDNTVVVTIVHDVQVFDSLPNDIFKPYDVPVDIIITSNEIIRVENRLNRPKDVFWNYISKRRLLEMPPLQLLRTKQEQNADLDCTLKDVDSEPEEIPPSPRTYKKSKGYRQKRYSTRSEINDSVFKDNEVSKHRPTKSSSAPVSKNTDSKIKHKRAKSTSSQKHRSSSIEKRTNQNDKRELRSSSKKPNKRRTKSESAKTVTSPVTLTESKSCNDVQADSPSIDTPKNKQRRPRPKQSRKRINSDDIDKQSINQSNSNSKYNSRSNSRATRRDYIDRQDLGREMSIGRKSQRDYLPSPKKYYSQNYRQNSYSQERSSYGSIRSNSRTQYRDSNRSAVMQQNRYSNGPTVRPTRYFNGPMVRHDSYNGPDPRQNNGINHHGIRHNSYSNDPLSRQNSFYDGVISRRNSFSKGSAIRQDNYTSSRVFRPPHYRNGMASQTDERDYVQQSRPHFNNNNNRIGYFNSNEKPNYSRSSSGDEFVLKVGNIANNVRVRDLKAALMERGVKPMHITWRGPRGFAYLRYSNSSDLDKDNVMGSLQNVRIKPNGVETAQTQTLIVTECQFS
uniref:Methenyltetrahydrofolate synthase domain-containing protein n=1 Tax=Schizaphis graminum TaxID=13262 RepID=A0A2S2NFS7_SCHGA